MAIKKSELYSSIWVSCEDIIRIYLLLHCCPLQEQKYGIFQEINFTYNC